MNREECVDLDEKSRQSLCLSLANRSFDVQEEEKVDVIKETHDDDCCHVKQVIDCRTSASLDLISSPRAARMSENNAKLSVEMLTEIVEQCRRNEERLRTLARRTRRQRKKVERFLEQAKQQQRAKPRVRFQLESKDGPDELSDLANRCEGLLSQLRIRRHQVHDVAQKEMEPRLDDVREKIFQLRLQQHELIRSTD